MARVEDITHEGVIKRIDGRHVLVDVELSEACSGCSARKSCSLGTATDRRTIDVVTDTAEEFTVGERVVVSARKRVGAMAVALSYAVPLAVLLAALVTCIACGLPEGLSALATIGAVAVYYALLWSAKEKISQKVSFTISKMKK